jgi:hypothetical protein
MEFPTLNLVYMWLAAELFALFSFTSHALPASRPITRLESSYGLPRLTKSYFFTLRYPYSGYSHSVMTDISEKAVIGSRAYLAIYSQHFLRHVFHIQSPIALPSLQTYDEVKRDSQHPAVPCDRSPESIISAIANSRSTRSLLLASDRNGAYIIGDMYTCTNAPVSFLGSREPSSTVPPKQRPNIASIWSSSRVCCALACLLV